MWFLGPLTVLEDAGGLGRSGFHRKIALHIGEALPLGNDHAHFALAGT